MKVKHQHLKILEYLLRSSIFKTEKFKFFKVCSCMHSILGRGSLAQAPASVRYGMRSACGTAEALLSLQLVCIVGSTVSHLSPEKIP